VIIAAMPAAASMRVRFIVLLDSSEI
jgi:hypothetical protein